MKKLNILTLFLLISVISGFVVKAETTAASAYAGGDGTKTSPYKISNLAELRRLSETSADWSSHFEITKNINANETKTWNNGAGFSPIGNSSASFNGSLNGNFNSIVGIYVNAPNLQDAGFFGRSTADTIQNVVLLNVNITGKTNVGGLIGDFGSDIKNVVANCAVSGSITSSDNAGGIVGDFDKNGTVSPAILDCIAFDINVHANNRAGGITSINRGSVVRCAVFGSITGTKPGAIVSLNHTYCTVLNNYCVGSNVLVFENYESATFSECVYDGTVTNYANTGAIGTAAFENHYTFLSWNGSNWTFDSKFTITTINYIDASPRPYPKWYVDNVSLHEVAFEVSANEDVPAITSNIEIGGKILTCDNQGLANIYLPNDVYSYTASLGIGSTNGSITVNNAKITEQVNIEVDFYEVNFTTNAEGSLTGETSQTIFNGGNTSTVSAIPLDEYYFEKWQLSNGSTYSTVNPLTIDNVSGAMSLTAIYVLIPTYTVTFVAGSNGRVTGNLEQKLLEFNDPTVVEAVPNVNHLFKEWQLANGDVYSTDNPLSITDISTDITLTAVFEAGITYYAGGIGTQNNPYQIETLDQLRHLSETNTDWGYNFELTANIDASETSTWNEGKGFSPIGIASTPFSGKLNGNYHAIDGLYIHDESLELAGLFGRSTADTIQNIILTNVNITGGKFAGGVVGAFGASYETVVTNCAVSGTITGNNIVGGIVGGFYSGTVSPRIQDCLAYNITVNGSISQGYSGGIIGENRGIVSLCAVFGNITGKTPAGIVGKNNKYCTVGFCYNVGEESLVESNTGTVRDVFFDKTVSPSNGQYGIETADFAAESTFSNWRGTVWSFSDYFTITTISGIDAYPRPYPKWYIIAQQVPTTTNMTTEGDISMYPNPATDDITILGAAGLTVNIYNTSGTQEVNTIATTNHFTLNISDLSAGVYIILVGDKTPQKLIIQ